MNTPLAQLSRTELEAANAEAIDIIDELMPVLDHAVNQDDEAHTAHLLTRLGQLGPAMSTLVMMQCMAQMRLLHYEVRHVEKENMRLERRLRNKKK